MKAAAEIQKVLISKPGADLANGEKRASKETAGFRHPKGGMILEHGHPGFFFEYRSHVLITEKKFFFQGGGREGFGNVACQEGLDLVRQRRTGCGLIIGESNQCENGK